MRKRHVLGVVAVALVGGALAVPTGAGAASSGGSCVGQAASAPTAYPTQKADFVTTFAGPGYGQDVSAFAMFDRGSCPPLP
jgi:hypothetical protein